MIAKQYCQTESTLGYAATQEKKEGQRETLALPFTSMQGADNRGETVQELMIHIKYLNDYKNVKLRNYPPIYPIDICIYILYIYTKVMNY